MTTHFEWTKMRLPNINSQLNISNVIRLLSGFACLLIISSVAFAQPASGTVKRLTLKSTVLVVPVAREMMMARPASARGSASVSTT